MKHILLAAALALAPVEAWGQSALPGLSPSQSQKLMQAINSMPPENCNAPEALSIMMQAIQEDVGDRTGLQLVNITNIKTDWINEKTGDWQCDVTTVWSEGPETRGTFRLYHNAVGNVVYFWDGKENLPPPQ